MDTLTPLNVFVALTLKLRNNGVVGLVIRCLKWKRYMNHITQSIFTSDIGYCLCFRSGNILGGLTNRLLLKVLC